MNFFEIDDLNFDKKIILEPTGLPADLGSKIFMDLSKDKNFSTLEQVPNIVFSKGFSFVDDGGKNLLKVGQIKSGKKNLVNYAVINGGAQFEVKNETNNFFVSFVKNKLNVFNKESDFVSFLEKQKNQKFKSEDHKAAFEWLEKGQTGTSSMTLCKILFPDLTHGKLEDLKEGLPRDYDDFNRCAKFINSLPKGKERLKDLKLEDSSSWYKIIKNWNIIESGMNSKEPEVREKGLSFLKEEFVNKKSFR